MNGTPLWRTILISLGSGALLLLLGYLGHTITTSADRLTSVESRVDGVADNQVSVNTRLDRIQETLNQLVGATNERNRLETLRTSKHRDKE